MSEKTKALVVPPQPGELVTQQAELMAKALLGFLPGGAALPVPTRMAMAMLAVQNGLDPFLGEVYAIPLKKENEQTHKWETSYALGIGRGGWLRNAERTGLYRGHDIRFPTTDESKALGLGPADIGQVCTVFKANGVTRHSGEERVVGYGVVRGDDKTRMNHFTCARKRAFVDALRMAFPMRKLRDEDGEQMQIRVVDEETGEVMSNGHDLRGGTAAQTPAPEEDAQASEFTEAAAQSPESGSETLYQPEGMPVVVTPPRASSLPQSPQAKAMNRGELMTSLNNLAREWYGGASGIALTNHLKKTFNKVAMGDLTMDELADQVGVFQKRIAERKADMDAQPQLVGVTA